MKILVFICLSLLAILPVTASSLETEDTHPFDSGTEIVVGNNSALDFSKFNIDASSVPFTIKRKEISDMIVGNISVFISDKPWNDSMMSDYQLRHGSNPQRLVIAAFSAKADIRHQEALGPKELAEIFSTRNGSSLLYLYIGESASYQDSQSIASFIMEDAQAWFVEQGLIAIPDSVYQKNLVTLGLKDPVYPGGYK
jgi:hypothetical protein